jgi:hypothetical protein
MSRLVDLYPAAWRARYEDEFLILLAERPPGAREIVDIALGALDARLQPQVTGTGERPPVDMPGRLQGMAAIVGGLIWCGTYLGPGLAFGGGEEWGGLIVLAVVFMLISLPGPYMAAYPKQLAVGLGAVVASVLLWLGAVLPYGLLLVGPGFTLVLTILAGSLALAATRVGFVARDRWRLLGVVLAAPVIGAVLASVGAFALGFWIPLAVATALPYGIAWIAIGVRIVGGSGGTLEPALATPGGPAGGPAARPAA